MKLEGSALRLSATDLAAHLGCRHLTELDRLAAEGALRPPVWRDPMLDVLVERGLAHEAGYLAHLRDEERLEVVRLDGDGAPERAAAETLAAMRAGVPVIAALAGAHPESSASLGLGTDLRIETERVHACALVAGEVVHLTAFPAVE